MISEVDLKRERTFTVSLEGATTLFTTMLRQLFVLHAGSIAAILAFIGQGINGAQKQVVWDIAYECLPYFFGGVIISFVMLLAGYLYHMHIALAVRDGEEQSGDTCGAKWGLGIALGLFVPNVALFCAGAYKAYLKMPALLH